MWGRRFPDISNLWLLLREYKTKKIDNHMKGLRGITMRRYTEQELVAIAKRENNVKRSYLVVNRLQGKHVPVLPGEAMELFDTLAECVERKEEEQILCIGFAETATAIGARVAVCLDCYYMQTTREVVEGAEYIYFTESHSHATEQTLVAQDLDALAALADRILFVEDEVTTGNTIWNIIEILKKRYDKKLRFSVASILNGMNETDFARYQEAGIDMYYLVKTSHDAYADIAQGYAGKGRQINLPIIGSGIQVQRLELGEHCDTRRGVWAREYAVYCEKVWEKLLQAGVWKPGEELLVLGTEECMYPGLYVAYRLQQAGETVCYHATTRSPILPGVEEGYPLHSRYTLRSLYDGERTNFIYNLKTYDRVLILTDAKRGSRGILSKGEDTLAQALRLEGCENFCFVYM